MVWMTSQKDKEGTIAAKWIGKESLEHLHKSCRRDGDRRVIVSYIVRDAAAWTLGGGKAALPRGYCRFRRYEWHGKIVSEKSL